MYVLLLVACATFGGQTHCQTFERQPHYDTERLCRVAESVEKGRYAKRQAERASWLSYRWRCEDRRSPISQARPGSDMSVTKF